MLCVSIALQFAMAFWNSSGNNAIPLHITLNESTAV